MRHDMKKKNRSKKRSPAAFSTLELIIVLAIVILVLGISSVRFIGFQDQTRIETVRGDLKALQSAIDHYYLNNNKAIPAGDDWQTTDLANDDPRVLGPILHDPFQGENEQYEYLTSPNSKYYVVYSFGIDRQADITGIDNSGLILGISDDDIFLTNGGGTFSLGAAAIPPKPPCKGCKCNCP